MLELSVVLESQGDLPTYTIIASSSELNAKPQPRITSNHSRGARVFGSPCDRLTKLLQTLAEIRVRVRATRCQHRVVGREVRKNR